MEKKTSKKASIIIIVSSVVVIAVALVLMLCFKDKDVESPVSDDADIVETTDVTTDTPIEDDERVSAAIDTVTCFFEAYKNREEAAKDYISFNSVDTAPIKYGEYQGYCADKLKYKIKAAEKADADTVRLELEIETIDLAAILEFLNTMEFKSDEQLLDSFNSAVSADDVPTCKYSCSIICKEYADGVRIVYNSELSNALLGGMGAYLVQTEDN